MFDKKNMTITSTINVKLIDCFITLPLMRIERGE